MSAAARAPADAEDTNDPLPTPPPSVANAGKEAGRRKKGSARRVIPLALLLAGGAYASFYWFTHRFLESTDDAQIEADVVPIAVRASGTVTAIHFTDNQAVKAGDLLLEIDPAPAKARLAQAEAELAAAKAAADAADATAALTESNALGGKKIAQASVDGATVSVAVTADTITEAKAQTTAAKAARDKAKADLDRTRALVDTGAAPASQLESVQAAFDAADASWAQANARVATMQASTLAAQSKVTEASARLALADNVDAQIKEAKAKAAATRARVATAEATRDLAALDVTYTKVVAPRAGVVSKRSASVGQNVSMNQTVLMLVPTDAIWVTANFKETQLARMRVGQPVKIDVDAYGGREIRGEVESFSGATGAKFALLPPDNATGNFTKVVQRVPVRIKLVEAPHDLPLRPGMSVELAVDTKGTK